MREESTTLPIKLTQVPWISNRNPSLFLARAKEHIAIALQPIVDSQSGHVVAYEALMRGCERLGFATIADLLDHAHNIDVLLDLEVELHRQAIAAFKRAPRDFGTLLFLNLDGRTAKRMDQVCASLETETKEQGLKPGDVCLELSESNQDFSLTALEGQTRLLREYGFRVAVDDYGAGSSGLQMLYRANPDFLKIDRFFINGMETDARKRLFVGSVVDLAHTLGIAIVAEGVESIAELRCCHGIRCDLVQGYIIARPTTVMSELSISYNIVTEANQHRQRVMQADDIRHLLEPYAWLDEDVSLVDVLRLFRENPTQNNIPIIDSGGRPRGIVREIDIKPFLYSPFGRDLLQNPASGFRLSLFLRPVPTADITINLRHMIETHQDRLDDGVLVTDGQRYIGYLSAAALVKIINNIRIDEAHGANPLTRLPGNELISSFITKARRETAMSRLLCYFDFDNFKPFNDAYGFRIGDRAILMFRDIMASHAANREIFLGHIGGDDFFAGAVGAPCSALFDSLKDIREEFARAVASLYSAEDRLRGFISGTNRAGELACWPLMTCSIAALQLLPGAEDVGVDDISRMIADLKRQAKATPAGIVTRTFQPRVSIPKDDESIFSYAC